MLVAVLAAFVSAAFFAASSAVQHRAAGSDNPDDQSGAKLFTRLAHEPRWWLGLSMSAVAFALHAFALSRGMLAVVQPIIVSGLVFAVFVRAALERRLPPRATIGWCLVTWAGLAALIAVFHASAPEPANLIQAAWFVAAGVLVVIGLLLAAKRVRIDERRGLVFAAAAGVLFGLVAGLVKVVLTQASPAPWSVMAHWSFWALLVVGAGAILVNQRAFQATRLSVTMPVVNIVNVVVAMSFGFMVFNEHIFSSPFTFVGELAGLAVIGLGVSQLASRGNRPDDGQTGDAQPGDGSGVTRYRFLVGLAMHAPERHQTSKNWPIGEDQDPLPS